jgi:hypothetical protein
MKNKIIELVDSSLATGTFLVGYIDVAYARLVEVLGLPNSESDGYKTDAEWTLKINDKVLTIYNWKNGRNYNGEHGLEVEDISRWHIGGGDDVDAEIKILKSELV